MKLHLLFLTILIPASLKADILIFPSKVKQNLVLNATLKKFIADVLYTDKPALNLGCDVKVREIVEERKFSDGYRRVDMLEVIYHTENFSLPREKMYFPIGSQVSREVKNSKFSGLIEEIVMEAEDMENSRFIFQHNGRGEIVWMSYEDDLRTAPCQVR